MPVVEACELHWALGQLLVAEEEAEGGGGNKAVHDSPIVVVDGSGGGCSEPLTGRRRIERRGGSDTVHRVGGKTKMW
jgi:hypothetical protein